MKRASVSLDQSHAIDDEAKAKFKYQTSLNEYLELQKILRQEYVSRKRKLQAAKGKRERIIAEVRFLRRKRKNLLSRQAPNTERVPLQLPNSDIESNTLLGRRNQSTSDVLVSNSHLKNEEEEGNIHDKNVRIMKKLKSGLVQDKCLGKRKMRWPDQVTLKV